MADVTLKSIRATTPKGLPDSLDGVVLTVLNTELGNADTSYFYFDLVKAGYNIFALEFEIQATTLTIEGSNENPSVEDDDVTWKDITDVVTSGVATSFTTTGTLTVLFALPWSRLRVKRVTTNATNALKLILTRGRAN